MDNRVLKNYIYFVSRIVRKYESTIALNQEIMEEIDILLNFLRNETFNRKYPVVKMLEQRFGLSGETKLSIIQIAKSFNLKPANTSGKILDLIKFIREKHGKFFNSIVHKKYGEFLCSIDTPVLEIPISKLGFSTRTFRCLSRYRVKTIGELTVLNDQNLLKIRGFGRKSLCEVKDMLRTKNLYLGIDPKNIYS